MTEPAPENVPPQDVSAERATLGAMLLSRDAIGDISDILTGTDFYQPRHETIYDTILKLHAGGQAVDVLTVGDAITRAGELPMLGGNTAYLHELPMECPSPTSGEYYAGIVARAAVRRRLITAAASIQDMARRGGDEDDMVEQARKAVDDTSRATADKVESFGETIDAMLDTLDEAPNHVPTPWRDLNAIIGGLRPGGLYIVAARPSVGKSVAALQLAKSLTAHGSVAFVSLEMSNADVQMRAVAADLHIDLKRLMDRQLLDEDWTKIRARRANWQTVPLYVDDNSGVTITDIKRFARSVNRRQPLAGIVVDYLQLLAAPTGDKRNRQEFVADMSRQLKILAMQMNVPVIALSQLNRGAAQTDRMPTISDLRESGAIEQDADVVILLHREIIGDKRGDLTMIVGKNRNGRTDVADMQFFGHYSSIYDA
ncbi:replicative DNA helicase [Arthrobacter sp. efr-133-TYG-118]|uniref:replicative DNA helicase n=1 Tax=Arthrobacter sp. efr-133-TYG-118 TaxID=3040279 RepID=UPI00254EF7C3|nr:replicative DNA helicase [Arthrobacter sp. efr-133-TYG-118]